MKKIQNNISVALGQLDIKIFDKEYNIDKIESMVREAHKAKKIDLMVFPEAAVSGYCFISLEESKKAAIRQDGPEIKRIQKLCSELNVSLAFGAVEEENGDIFNTCFFLEPDGTIFKYHKSHLPFLGLDKFVKRGDGYRSINTRFGPVGIIICYDLRFPEPARVLALQGARLIIQPTNLPVGGEAHMDYFGRARATENRVHLLSCNRCGDERGSHFFGRSQVVDYTGRVLSEAGEDESIVYANLDLALSEKKNIIVIPSEYETHIFEDRSPELYSCITDPVDERGYCIK